MKKLLLGSMFLMSAAATQAQVIADTVNMGPQYAQNKWYSLEDDEVDSASATNWHIAFAATAAMSSPLTTAIHINHKVASLYEVVGALPADFATTTTLDTANWPQLRNTDTLWSYGAFNVPTTPDIGMDYGFGSYNTGTHIIEANRIFVLKYGTTFKKMYITLDPNSAAKYYLFTFANMDNSDMTTDTLFINNYVGRNFFYYDVENKVEIDREPGNENWDVLFTQYWDNAMGYQVTGLLHNVDVEAVKVTLQEETTYNDFLAHQTGPYINTIGYDWKVLNQSFTYDMADSTLYFIKALNGDIWKVVFTGFIGSSAGSFRFTKEKLATASVQNVSGKNEASLAVYPNPASGGNATVAYNLNSNNKVARMMVMDMTGRVVIATQMDNQKGLHQQVINTQNLAAGTYIINVMTDAGAMQTKLSVQ